MSEPKFGYKNLIKAKKEGKVKAFFSLIVPTETEFGDLEIAGFKIIEGSQGLFVSLPNRAVKGGSVATVDLESGTATRTSSPDNIKYYNNLRFQSQEKYDMFRKELNENVLPLIRRELSVV